MKLLKGYDNSLILTQAMRSCQSLTTLDGAIYNRPRSSERTWNVTMRRVERSHLLSIFKAALAAADPEAAVRRHVVVQGDLLRVDDATHDLSAVRRILVVGAGKASAFMARALEGLLGERITAGWVNVKVGHGLPLDRIAVHEAGHPIPDAAGVEGARRIVRVLSEAGSDDLVLCCLSGGGSALLPLPAEGVTLEEKRDVTGALLESGAPINDVNAVRKHLSRVKGGQLAAVAAPARVITLILSDVIGDPLDVIASGPTAPDTTTFRQALDVLDSYGLTDRASPGVLAHLRSGAKGELPETPKPGDPLFERVRNVIVANNRAAVAAAATRASELGYRARVISSELSGEARTAAAKQAALARRVASERSPVAPPACLVSGGETTVTVRGDGLGGRNQEFALAAAIALAGTRGICLLAAGTDGTDGPTDAAGAFADGETVSRASAMGLAARDALDRNDSYHFFQALGDLLKTGPTGTNVMDLYLFLVSGADCADAGG